MKKIALFLVFVLIFGVFSACGGSNGGDVSPDGASSDYSDISDESIEDSSAPQQEDTEIKIEHETVVSVGKSYVYDMGEANKSYPDSYNLEMTDGAQGVSADYMHEGFSGFSRSSGNVAVIIDLGEDSKRIYKFGVSYFSGWEAGIGPFGAASVSVSADGEVFERVGQISHSAPEDNTVQTAWLALETPIDCRYVRFELTHRSSSLFLDELIVVADVAANSKVQAYYEKIAQTYNESKLSENAVIAPTGEAVDRTLNKYSATTGRKYTVKGDIAEKFPDNYKLTDGDAPGASPASDNWVGFEGGKQVEITVDMGKKARIAEMEIAMLSQPNVGVLLPYYVDFYVSRDGKKFQLAGRIYAPDDPQTVNFSYSLKFQNEAEAKTIKFVLAQTECNYFLCEEVSAYYYDEKCRELFVYDDIVFEPAGEKVYLDNADDKQVNLVQGLKYQIESVTPLSATNYASTNSKESDGKLTDGVYTESTDYSSTAWFKARGGINRSIYFDLGYQAEIKGLKGSFLQYADIGVGRPAQMTLYASNDGISWYNVLTVKLPDAENDPSMVVGEGFLETPVEARYLRVSFDVVVHVFADEIEIYGSKKVTGKAVMPEANGTSVITLNGYTNARNDLLGGASDIVLIPMTDDFAMDKNYMLPHAAYLDKEGKILDTMFDGFLFCPSSTWLENASHWEPEKPNNANDWNAMIDYALQEGINMPALEETVGDVKAALGLTDYKAKVYISVLHTTTLCESFGDFDGDGIDEDVTTLDGLGKLYEMYMTKFLERFNEQGFENLVFGGFYWQEEAVLKDVENDEESVRLCAETAKSLGSELFWIPYYQSRGYEDWSSYGFSVATMQPNYAFRAEVELDRFTSAVELIKYFGMGIEIEITEMALTEKIYFDKYMDYLRGGIEYGFMDGSIHTYYADLDDFYRACYSESLMGRMIYDKTYEFIKGTLGEEKPKAAGGDYSGKANRILKGELFENPEGLLSAEAVKYTQHGCVTINPDGSFTYYPNADFCGTDSFEYRIFDGITYSEPVTVNITVE